MITKQDLRLGNLFKEGVVCKINGRAGAKVHVCGRLEYKDGKLKNRTEVPAESLTPIPLSPQVLVEWCGFKKSLDSFYNLIVKGDKINIPLTKENEVYLIVGLVKLQYLHELQNLYFVLNGKELEIKE